jgi:hypothetical protein
MLVRILEAWVQVSWSAFRQRRLTGPSATESLVAIQTRLSVSAGGRAKAATVGCVVWVSNRNIGTCNIRASSGVVFVESEDFGFFLVEVLAGVGGFVFESFDKAVEANCDQGTESRAEPVDPVVAWEAAEGNAGAE